MTIRRTEEDLLHPERVFFRLIQDYSSGILQNRPNSAFLRARVEEVDHEGGRLESVPPNPPNSVRARIYTAGMDFNTPSVMLTVFYPLGDLRPVLPGEHVIVTYEDAAQTSGYWLGILPSHSDVNYADPDLAISSSTDISNAFGDASGDPPKAPNIPAQYGGLTEGQSPETERIISAVETQTSRWAGKKVLLAGDSQAAGPPGITFGNYLRDHGVTDFIRDGRVGWGVPAWLAGRQHASESLRPTLSDLIDQHSPDIIVLMLGGNDGGGAALRSDYETRVTSLWSDAQRATSFSLWCGPPTAVGAAAPRQPGRDTAANKIRNVVDGRHFVDIRQLTTSTDGRRPDGVHFLVSSPALEPIAAMIYEAGNAL